jgi:hypothetical protein
MDKKEMIKQLEDIKKTLQKTDSLIVDDEHDSIDYLKFAVWIGLLIGCASVWYSVVTNGFFITSMWLIITSAVVGIWLRVSGRA